LFFNNFSDNQTEQQFCESMIVSGSDRYGNINDTARFLFRKNALSWHSYMTSQGWTNQELNLLLDRVEIATRNISTKKFKPSDWLPREYRGEADMFPVGYEPPEDNLYDYLTVITESNTT
jgi:hypothetical protein